MARPESPELVSQTAVLLEVGARALTLHAGAGGRDAIARDKAALARTALAARAAAALQLQIGACAIGGLFEHEDPETAIGAADDELGTHDPWNPRLLGVAGHAFDFWILHPYVVEPTDARLGLGRRIERNVCALRSLDPARPIAIHRAWVPARRRHNDERAREH